nr:MAG TPA: hypothetical protein [Crassvirales sp.]
MLLVMLNLLVLLISCNLVILQICLEDLVDLEAVVWLE